MRLHRKERVGELIRDELSELFLRELEVSGALTTITNVEVSGDLKHAKVMVSVLPSERANDVLKILAARRGYFQFLLVRKLSIKPLPEIMFVIDHGPERAAIIEKDLIEVEKKEGKL